MVKSSSVFCVGSGMRRIHRVLLVLICGSITFCYFGLPINFVLLNQTYSTQQQANDANFTKNEENFLSLGVEVEVENPEINLDNFNIDPEYV